VYPKTKAFKRQATAAAKAGRAIQRDVDAKEKSGRGKPKKGAMQAGERTYPAPPLPAQHLNKPGHEADLDLKPMYDNPHYKGSDKLLDMVALITGGDSGIGRAVAVF
jgi:hypothetical protein